MKLSNNRETESQLATSCHQTKLPLYQIELWHKGAPWELPNNSDYCPALHKLTAMPCCWRQQQYNSLNMEKLSWWLCSSFPPIYPNVFGTWKYSIYSEHYQRSKHQPSIKSFHLKWRPTYKIGKCKGAIKLVGEVDQYLIWPSCNLSYKWLCTACSRKWPSFVSKSCL